MGTVVFFATENVVKKFFYFILGWIFLILGITGLAQPWPHTVFFILSSICFAKSWPWMARRIDRFFETELSAWKKERRIVVSRRTKWISVGGLMFSLAIYYFFMEHPARFAFAMISIFFTAIILTRPST